MKLTDIKIKNAKPKKKLYKLMDGRGLYLQVSPSGGKYWRYNYHFLGKHKTLSIGLYPDITLKEARNKHFEARKMLDEDIDPAFQKKVKSHYGLSKQKIAFSLSINSQVYFKAGI